MDDTERAPEPEIVDDAALLAEMEADEAPEAEGEPEPKPAPDEGVDRDEKYNNLSNALKEARYESRQFKRELEEIKGLLRPNAKQRDTDPWFDTDIPDPDADPIGAVRALAQMVHAQRVQQYEQQQAQQRQQQEAQTYQTLTGYMEQGEAEFRQQAPDYNDAATYLVQSRKAELKALGYPDEQIDEGIRYEYLQLINDAAQRGQNPAALVYAQANARGYARKAAQQTNSATQRLDAMRQADALPKAPKSGGGNKGGSVTEDMLMSAKGAEFDKLWAQFERQNAQ